MARVALCLGPRGDLGGLSGLPGTTHSPPPRPGVSAVRGPPPHFLAKGWSRPRASPPSHLHLQSCFPLVVAHLPVRRGRGGGRRAGRGAQVRARRRCRRKVTAGWAGGWGEDARRTGRLTDGRTDGRTDDRECWQPGSSPGVGLWPQPWSGDCVRWSGWRGARPAAARGSTASWICCWGCTTSSAAPPCGGSATWRSS